MGTLPPELWIVVFLGGIGILTAGRAIIRLRRDLASQRKFIRHLIEEHERERKQIREAREHIATNLTRLLSATDNHGAGSTIRSLAQDALAAANNLQLSPDGPAEDRLTSALHHLFGRISPPTHLQKDIDNIDGLLPPGDAGHVYRIFEKCCDELLRSPQPGYVTVLIKKASTVLHATIETDGTALDTSRMQETVERASIIGGMMTIDSPSPGRTTFTLTFPLPA